MTNKAISPVRRSLLAATALTGVAAFSAPAFAQDDTIIVTGSRLNQANISSAIKVCGHCCLLATHLYGRHFRP